MLPDSDMLTELTLTSRWPSPERRDWNLQTVACAAGGVPGDPLTVTLTPWSKGRENCALCACAQCHLRPWPLTQALPTLRHFIFEGASRKQLIIEEAAWAGVVAAL